MAKRTVSEEELEVNNEEEEEEELEFEGEFEDEFESESIEEGESEKIEENEKMEEVQEEKDDFIIIKEPPEGITLDPEEEEKVDIKVWDPVLQPLKAGEVLEHDPSAYDLLHFFHVEWPCLSFDFIPDNLGMKRTKFPHTVFLAAGTQAAANQQNKIMILKLSDLEKTKDEDSDDEGFNLDDDSGNLDADPVLEYKHLDAQATINRLRVCPHQPNIVASFLSNSVVSIYNMEDHLKALATSSFKKPTFLKPIQVFSGHPKEGWALNWAIKSPGSLLTGDCGSHIYCWDPQSGGTWHIDKVPYSGHTDSVEDIQWSPSEAEVFASCSVDKNILLWDRRKGKTPAASIEAHETDVNGISWNHKRAFLMLSGADDGTFRVWDFRKLGKGPGGKTQHQFSFLWHTAAITSLEWNPNDDAEFVVSSEDDSVTIWDLSLTTEKTKVEGREIPSQLLFIHRGQQSIKEVHWHNQIPGLIASTSADSFCVFKPRDFTS